LFPIPCDQKWLRNLAVAQVLVEAMDAIDQRYPKPTVDLDQIRREYHATAAPEHAKAKQGRR
jgi:hypothetical protein